MAVDAATRTSTSRGALARPGSETPAALSALCDPQLEAAAKRVLASPLWRGDALNIEEAAIELLHVAHAVERADCEAAPAPVSLGQKRLRRRLLDLLRAELVAGWSARPQEIDAAQVVPRLATLESIRRTLEPDWRHGLTSHLHEPDSLELVVEVAHDLRSPLTSIMFLAETLRKGQSGSINDVQKQQLGIIYSAALGLVSIASDVIDIAHGGDSLDEIGPAAFSVVELFDSVRAMVAPMAEEKRLKLRMWPSENDLRIGHAVPLGRVLLNLVTNAIKFTEEGYVELSARERGPRLVEFSVRDTGRGLHEEASGDDLYQPFRRRPDRSGFRFSGTGLGLSICRRMVEAMGGQLRVESRMGWGTKFSFQLELPGARRV